MSSEDFKQQLQNIPNQNASVFIEKHLRNLKDRLSNWEVYLRDEHALLESLKPKDKYTISHTRKTIDYANHMIDDIKEEIKYVSNLGVFV